QAVDLFQRPQSVAELTGLRGQPGVLDGDGGGIGEPPERRLVTVGERPGRAVVDADEAFDAVAGRDRGHQLRPDALGLDHGPELPGLAEARVLQPVLATERPPRGDDASRDAAVARELERAVFLVPRPDPVTERELIALGIA